jgi:3-hydroxybutyryl-CoA dehydratase
LNDSLSEYTFDEIKLNQEKIFHILVTEEMINNFGKLSGDLNPLHMDENYAKNTNFGRRVCHGMLLTSFFSQLVGMYIPGKNALYLSQSVNFVSPCFIGDNITIHGKVIDKSNSTKIITIATNIFNDQSKNLVSGIAKVVVRV